jgi:quinol monooxygenase YgiN
MIIVAGTLRVPPDRMAALRPAAEAVISATRAEPGCVVYSFAEDLLHLGLIRIYEIWNNREDLAAHGRAPHMSPWRQAVSEAGAYDRDIRTFEASGGELI